MSSIFSLSLAQPVLHEVKAAVNPALELPSAVPDMRQDSKAWEALQVILAPAQVAEEFPKDYCCPVTRCLMRDPVSTVDGQTYEREAIEAWLAEIAVC